MRLAIRRVFRENNMQQFRSKAGVLSTSLLMTAAALYFSYTQPQAQSSTRLPFTATWDSGNLYADWDGFRNTTGATVSTTGCFSGRCLRTPLVAGTVSDNYGDFYFGDHTGQNGAKVEEVWLRVYSKFDPGIQWPNRTQKIVLLNLTDGVSSERRYQVMLDVSPQGQYFVERSDIGAWQFNGMGQNIGSPVSVRVGQWDKLKMYVRLNTPNQSNGIVRMWVNDTLKLEYTNVNIRAGSNYGINKMILTTYATQTSPANGVQWHDDVTLSLTDPDASGGGQTPAAPSNLRIVS
jgi:hypothetical protein